MFIHYVREKQKEKQQTIVPQTVLNMQKQVTNLSIFKGDLPDQRNTLVLGPSVCQVKVSQWAKVDHVRDTLAHRFVDHIVSTETLGLRDLARSVKQLRKVQDNKYKQKNNIKTVGNAWTPHRSKDGAVTHPKAAKNVQSSRRMFATFSYVR